MSTVRFIGEVLADGTIRLPAGVPFAPGKAQVTIEQADAAKSPSVPRVARDLAELAAGIDSTDLPDDLAQNHDHCLRGAAKGIDQS